MEIKIVVDAKGLACPMPIVRAKKALDTLASGEIMEVQATDKGSVNDFTAWINQTKNELVKQEESDGVYKFFVRKA